jgi:hypothetical protein
MYNPSFESDLPVDEKHGKSYDINNSINASLASDVNIKEEKDRGNWGKGIEFLLSCIAMSGE